MRNVASYYKWDPFVINDLYLDELDHLGLFFWNSEVERISKEMKGK